ncbi:MAG: hypothetical protein QXU20_05050 [Candidatus Woesearchaeota archaeon]
MKKNTYFLVLLVFLIVVVFFWTKFSRRGTNFVLEWNVESNAYNPVVFDDYSFRLEGLEYSSEPKKVYDYCTKQANEGLESWCLQKGGVLRTRTGEYFSDNKICTYDYQVCLGWGFRLIATWANAQVIKEFIPDPNNRLTPTEEYLHFDYGGYHFDYKDFLYYANYPNLRRLNFEVSCSENSELVYTNLLYPIDNTPNEPGYRIYGYCKQKPKYYFIVDGGMNSKVVSSNILNITITIKNKGSVPVYNVTVRASPPSFEKAIPQRYFSVINPEETKIIVVPFDISEFVNSYASLQVYPEGIINGQKYDTTSDVLMLNIKTI